MNHASGNRVSWQFSLFPLLGFLLASLLLASCGERVERSCPTETPGSSVDGSPQVIDPLETATAPSTEQIQATWELGPHAQSGSAADLQGDQDCVRCHAPLEKSARSQVIDTKVDKPADVGSSDVGCAVCHPDEGGTLQGDVAWLAEPSGNRVEAVDSLSELCEKCHLAGDVEGHVSVIVAGVHSDYVCTDCHDAHDGSASCTGSGCHQPFQAECEPIQTHDKPHASVSCAGCHSVGDPEIDWDSERELWQTFYPVKQEGDTQFRAFPSHALTLEVVCERCHTPGDLPWGIEE